VKNNFLNYIHNYRGLAILLIVGNHCRVAFPWPKESIIHSLLLYGIDSPTILFVFISGFLFQYLNAEKFEYVSYLKKKVLYVIIPYVLVSIPALLDKLLLETDAPWMSPFYNSLYPPFKVLYMLCTGKHSGPFYFIPMIGLIFLISPILLRIQKLSYFSIIAAAVMGIGLFTFAYGFYGTTLESLLYFLPIYIMGIWASKNRNQIFAMSNYLFFSVIATYLMIFLLEMTELIHTQHLNYFEPTPTYFTTQFNWGKLKEMLLAIIILLLFYRYRDKDFRLLHWLGSASFGIYFVHIYFINLVVYLVSKTNLLEYQNGVSYVIFTVLTIFISSLTVFIIKKIFKGRSRILIGS
jgi:probable poly-beta-1,6-N-acetyl-D-glucosamine export protein